VEWREGSEERRRRRRGKKGSLKEEEGEKNGRGCEHKGKEKRIRKQKGH
jgi:hypothetical protein